MHSVAIEKQKKLLNDISEQLDIVDILHKYPFECSGGQQQRVAIARALIHQPTIVFADEPTGNLDSISAQELMDLFVQINQQRETTIIMVTHDSLVASYGTKMYYMKDGKLDDSIEKQGMSKEEYYRKIVKKTSNLEI